ncbi:hypothetical protein EDD86DRAFT_206641 [Gorgonomyces haynaldii]|nr:hypothetical protein EDD86DRAFT_206641 [Gorgonomyces haynaldii]
MRDPSGNLIQGAHMVGFYRRILKLLNFGIKPVFVYDGSPPELKKQILRERRQRQHNSEQNAQKTAEKLLQAQLKQHALAPKKEADPFVIVEAPKKENPYQDSRLVSEMELRQFINEHVQDIDLSKINIDSQAFRGLPLQLQHELIVDLKNRARAPNQERALSMATGTALDFSKAQIQNLIHRNALTQRASSVAQNTEQGRVAGSRNKSYILVKNTVGVKMVETESEQQAVVTLEGMMGFAQERALEKSSKLVSSLESFLPQETLSFEEIVSQDLGFTFEPSADPQLNENEFEDDMDLELQKLLFQQSQPSNVVQESVSLPVEDPVKQSVDLILFEESIDPIPFEEVAVPTLFEDTVNTQPLEDNEAFLAHKMSLYEGTVDLSEILQVHIFDRTLEEIQLLTDKYQKRSGKSTIDSPEAKCFQFALEFLEAVKTRKQTLETKRLDLSDDDYIPVAIDQVFGKQHNSDDDWEEVEEIVPQGTLDSLALDAVKQHPDLYPPEIAEPEDQTEEPVKQTTIEDDAVVDDNVREEQVEDENIKEQPVEEEMVKEDLLVVEDVDIVKEQEAFDKFIQDIKKESLESVKKDLDDTIHELERQKRKEMRDASDLNTQMILETQELLRLFGLPYITAPMEAEAQCAFLQQSQLVDGIITDDSDVFLFGGSNIYRNIFNQNKYMERYTRDKIEQELSLDREQLILLAYLLKSDYSLGIKGIGPVTALEILTCFPGSSLDSLEQFKQWALNVKNGVLDPQDSDIHKRLRPLARRIDFPDRFPDPRVQSAYLHPVVDPSLKQFEWGQAQVDQIRRFMRKYCGWSEEKTDQSLVPVLKEVHRTQLTLDHYFAKKVPSKRVQTVIQSRKRRK